MLAAASTAALLVAMVLVVGQSGRNPLGIVALQTILRGESHDAMLRGNTGGAKVQQEQLVQEQIKKDIAKIVAQGPHKAHEEIHKLQQEAKREHSLVQKMDAQVDSQEEALQKVLEKARGKEKIGETDEREAREDVTKASEMRKKAQALRDESDEAKKRFLNAEKPVEIAVKLAQHDHKEYRKAEFAVAKQVTKLSEHPTDEALRNKVDGLVAKSKKAKRRMEGDSLLLKKLQKNTEEQETNGSMNYAQLRQKSVDEAKRAESVASRAVALAKEGHNQRAEAREVLQKVEKEMKAPDAMHDKVEHEKRELHEHERDIHRIELALNGGRGVKGKYAAERQELKREASGGSAHGKGHGDESAKKQGKIKLQHLSASESMRLDEQSHEHTSSNKGDPLLEAQDSYDKLEEREEAKEKARLRAEQESEHHAREDEHSDEEREMHQPSALSEAEKAAHIIGGKQSTFLAGLWGAKSPWDTEKGDVARGH